MLLRESKVTMTDLEIMIYLYRSAKSVKELRIFLSMSKNQNVSTYIARMKKKGFVTRDTQYQGLAYKLTQNGERIIGNLKRELDYAK